jgi:HTH-type transcriptional regulator/antitoxin HipB
VSASDLPATPLDLSGAVRRIRRLADLSQRELADRLAVSKSLIAGVESGVRGLDARVLARAAALAGLRLSLLDAAGNQIDGMSPDAVRDLSGRRFPAHLDTLHSDDRWWRYEHRFDRPEPWFTFDRVRGGRDTVRRSGGTPDDHHEPRPGDSPEEQRAQRRRDARRRAEEERQRRLLAGELAALDLGFRCSCPSACDELDDRSGRPVHAEACPCLCDLA